MSPGSTSFYSSWLSFVIIGVVVAGGGAAFAYTAGWLSPHALTSQKLVDALAPASGPAPGHRRNHAKGICFTGEFEANGSGVNLSKASMFAPGKYPVVGRLNLATPDPTARDAAVRVRGIGIQITGADSQQWRSAMIDPPFFPVSTPQAFYELLTASASKDPEAMKRFAGAHPEIAAFGEWAKSAPWTASYAQERFNSLNSFVFTNAAGTEHTVRWSLVPTIAATAIAPDDLAKRDADFLEQEIVERVKAGPVSWKLVVTLANPGDPTADPSKPWPTDRKAEEVGTLTATQIIPEDHGPCRDINFDPTVLPDGIRTSDDPFPAARSAAYAVSFDRRTAESGSYPRQQGATR
ncbi:catalase family peroxidase [Labrys sp. LIt4]|uniref:catalase family peroxidase n=1 Tax=Labrys sp. LIt4 TaxID=2821355 RepID=UPI001AE096A6|nr:catalase family peroxidase [Labrys sp. LIt4]MBP0580513.1 catalase family peroxidase [Labrys sp. LIt4]